MSTGNAQWIRIASGVVMAAGMVWAVFLAFWPVQYEGKGYLREGGAAEWPAPCGAPAFYEQSSFAEWLFDERELTDRDAKRFAAACADKVDTRARGAVGVIVITLPIAVLWVRCDVTRQAKRAAVV
ncbi:hypothetical protein OG302_01505 [Streptomyces sp. NBC_01283]|uniref:hypothetical protein n=1 Tax=Streptomyces sp. NBC_01283 TaxID=2903812 RepID=UPI00352CCD49|nr:hypothetical protein OG302_01505 [Streptomyces sp. NBC_01283]